MKIQKREATSEIPTASMADIAFLLIVYFMLTATFAATRGLDFSFPPDDDAPPVIEKEEAVLIEIQPDGTLRVDQKPMAVSGLTDYLRPKLVNNPTKPVIIRPEPSAPYGYMVQVLDELRQSEEILSAEIEHLKKINISLPTQREIDSFWY